MSDFYEDDEDPQTISAAFDRGPHGVTAFNAHPMIHMSDCGDPHAGCRAALDAAQDEIEKRIEGTESLRVAFGLAHAETLKHHTKVDAPKPWCRQCTTAPGVAYADWPCDTVRAIEDALGGGA